MSDEIDERYSTEIDIGQLDDVNKLPSPRDSDDTGTTWDISDDYGKSDLKKCREYSLLKIKGWPETKTQMEMRCKTILGKKICTRWPIVYKRHCELKYVLQVCHPTLDTVIDAVEDCIQTSVSAAVITFLISGNVSAAMAVLEPALKICLKAKLAESVVNGFSFRIYDVKSCSPWSKI